MYLYIIIAISLILNVRLIFSVLHLNKYKEKFLGINLTQQEKIIISCKFSESNEKFFVVVTQKDFHTIYSNSFYSVLLEFFSERSKTNNENSIFMDMGISVLELLLKDILEDIQKIIPNDDDEIIDMIEQYGIDKFYFV